MKLNILTKYVTKIIFMLAIVFISGCTSLNPVELQPNELQKQIVAGQILKVGDDVKLVTNEGKRIEFTVTKISENKVKGKNVEVDISSIVALETRDISTGKTALLTGGISYWIWILTSISTLLVL